MTSDTGERFRRLHEGPNAFVMPNPWDAGSARLLAGLGFEALATSSAAFANAHGRRDGDVTREEAIAHAADIVAATRLPVSADLENGFGDAPEDAAKTVQLAIEAGLAGCSIEDFSNSPDGSIYPLSHAVERIAAAVEAARSAPRPFVLTARSENFLRGRPDLDDTLKRLSAFAEAGADVLFAPGVRDLDMIRTVCAAVQKPVNVIVSYPKAGFSVADLGAAGVRRISLGPALSRAAFGALLRAAKEVQEHGTFTFMDDIPSYADIEAAMAPRGG